LARGGHRVTLWGRDNSRTQALQEKRSFTDRLSECRLADSVAVTSDFGLAVAADVFLFAIPTQSLRSFLQSYSWPIEASIWVNGAKGIEQKTLATSGAVMEYCAPSGANIFTLSGPSHAEELACGLPTSLVLAGHAMNMRTQLQEELSSDYCRVYASGDRRGVEVSGALKNVVALAAGMCDGLGFGDNARGALITRGLAEITRLGQKLGGRWETFAGLAGMGDLITTCASQHSRNRYVGYELGRGRSLEDILSKMTQVAEGVTTTPAALELGRTFDLEMPITEQVNAVLYQGKKPAEAARSLMTRALKEEAPTYAV
jgi:glycerol-3-phosphate dehydrogenase (NAD(P)+)